MSSESPFASIPDFKNMHFSMDVARYADEGDRYLIEKAENDYIVHVIKIEQMLLEAMADAQLRDIVTRCRDEYKK